MKIDTIVLGDLQANCYCVRAEETSTSCLLIDPGLNPEPLIHFLMHNGLTPEMIVATHGHADHIGGIETVRQHWPKVRVAIAKADAEMLTSPTKNLSILAEVMVQARPAEMYFDDDRYFEAAGLHFELIYTPGHSPVGFACMTPKRGSCSAGTRCLPARSGGQIFRAAIIHC